MFDSLISRPWIIGHRGASARRPENTLASFTHALELGADGVELDVQLSADRALVVLHDATLDRTTDGRGPLAMHTRHEIELLDAGTRFDPRFAGERVPFLEQVLEWASSSGAVLDIELKTNGRAGAESRILAEECVQVLRAHGLGANVLVSSFDHQALAHVRELAPDVPTGALFRCCSYQAIQTAAALGAGTILPGHASLSEPWMVAARELRLYVVAWTTSDPARIDKLLMLGVDGIVTDDPDVVTARVHP